VIAGRYRLVALLGRGGMGEVYRADDLTLDQPVALKFLPEGVAGDGERLMHFHNELRIARQVSHKNVCRLYDRGEADGRRFLTMEYVDGEDLSSLLRRIGRFPEDRAVAVARQLCAGVAAAHELGVIHRDLKPANVMIDGNGNVRITDFGIATVAGNASTGLAGTPQYMAPEQLAGQGASIKSDLYALGLILFEVFTGRRAHDASTLQELKALHDSGTVTTPSSIVGDLDPAVERVILRCLDRDPFRRPVSALAVAAALPGGDPLAAALAAGETPSPEVLAAAAETEAIPVLSGLSLLAVLVACAAAYALLSPRATLATLAPLQKAPAVLADRAQQILEDFGYRETPADTAQSFILPPDFPRWLVRSDQTVNRWSPAHHPMAPILLFWHRTSPEEMSPSRTSTSVSSTDPPLVLTGQSLVILDTRGRLVELRRVPPQRDAAKEAPPQPKWDAVFRAAGLDAAAFTPVDPEWSPKDFADTRAAWEGPMPDAADVNLRVEAAAYRGQVVSVYTVGPWARAGAMEPLAPPSGLDRARMTFIVLLNVAVLLCAALAARNNLRVSRADRRGAGRLASAYLVLVVVSWIIDSHHVAHAGMEFNNLVKAAAVITLQCGLLWILYIALEPYGRRFWPDGLLGWSRLLSGHVRDPRIGRDILIGAAFGGLLMLCDLFRTMSPLLIGRPPGIPTIGTEVDALNGFGPLYGTWVDQLFSSLESALFFVLILVVARLVVRRTWLAVGLAALVEVIVAGGGVPAGGVWWVYYLAQLLAIGLINFAIFHYGVLVTALMSVIDNFVSAVPIVTNGPSWAALPGLLSIGLVVGVACFGFYAARAGQPLFGSLGAEVKR
ncbi:MAG TPA: serine/threonine-protein kinase, partial [Vicinamibacterales bacterium]